MPKHPVRAQPCPCSGWIHTKATEANCPVFAARKAEQEAQKRATAAATQRAYRKTPKYRAYRERWRARPARKWVAFKAQARSRGIRMAIAEDVYVATVTAACAYCGGKKEGKLIGIDRIDSDGAYEEGNIVACCATCNFMKNTLNLDVFVTQCRRIAGHCSGSGSA